MRRVRGAYMRATGGACGTRGAHGAHGDRWCLWVPEATDGARGLVGGHLEVDLVALGEEGVEAQNQLVVPAKDLGHLLDHLLHFLFKTGITFCIV